jgi:hypothetical protein
MQLRSGPVDTTGPTSLSTSSCANWTLTPRCLFAGASWHNWPYFFAHTAAHCASRMYTTAAAYLIEITVPRLLWFTMLTPVAECLTAMT